jgi:outer membrane protein assembly factor BamD (BamD/ComL family)
VRNLYLLGLLAFILISCSPSEEELMQAGMEKMDGQAWAEAISYFDRALEQNPMQLLSTQREWRFFNSRSIKKLFLFLPKQ